jgi:predicted secreted protein
MRKLYLLINIFLIIGAMSANSFADSDEELTFIGFSADGKYLAYEVFSPFSEAGDGDTWKTYIVDTAKNSFAVQPVIVITDTARPEKPPAAYRIYKQKLVPAVLRKFGIKRGNKGRRVVSHLYNMWTPPEEKHAFPESDGTIKERIISRQKINFYRKPYSRRQNSSKFYQLILKVTHVIEGKEESDSAKLWLTLQDQTQNHFIKPQILQKDGNVLPHSRASARDYKIESVYLYKNKIAVFINVFGYEYEEIAMSYMVVTGVLDK